MQDEVNKQLVDYCDRLEKQNQELYKRLDLLLEIVTAIAEKDN